MTSIRKVVFVGQPEYFQVCYETDLNNLYDVRAYPVVFAPNGEADGDTLVDLIQFNPDVTVFFRGEYVSNELLAKLGGLKIGLSTEPLPKFINGQFEFTKDSLARFKFFLGFAKRNFDYAFHYDDISRSFMEMMGIRMSGYCMLPVATEVWTAQPAAKIWDVSFFGRSTEHRERFFGQLKRDTRFLHIVHGIMGRDTIPHYNASRIGLNVHCEPEMSWESRVHQMIACGVLVVSEPLSPNPYLIPGQHYLEVSAPEKMYETCRQILADPGPYEPIRLAGQTSVRKNLAARVVFPCLFEDCLAGRYRKPAYDIAFSRLPVFEVCAHYPGFEHLLDQFRVTHA